MVTSSHNHIKITTKIWNNHHSEPLEIKLNGSLTTIELKKPHPSKLVGGVQMQNGLVPHSHMVDTNLGGVSPDQGIPAPQQASQHRVPVPRRQVPTTSSCKNQQGLSWWKKLLEPQAVPLKEHTQAHLLRFTLSELQHQGSSLKGTSGIQGETEVSGIKASRGHCPFSKFSLHGAGRWMPYLRLHQPS